MTMPLYQRVVGVSAQKIDEDMFLATEQTGAIFHLNPVAAAFWHSLESPASLTNIVEVFAVAFPDQDRATLQRELSDLAMEMKKQKLIEQVA